MSKRYNISWNERQQNELRKAVRNFNDKIRRLEKKYPEKKGSLPERASIKSLKEIISTRQDLQREVNALKRFSRKGAEELTNPPPEYGNKELTLTKWEVNEILRRTSRVNKSRALKKAEIESIEMTSRGEKLGYTRGQVKMGTLDKAQLEPIVPFTRTMNNAERKRKFRTLRNESQIDYWDKRDNILKEAYIKGLNQNYNPEDVKEIVDKIRSMPIKKFREIFEREGGTRVFEWVYPKNRGRTRVKGRGKPREIDAPDKEYYDNLSALKNIYEVEEKGD